MYIHEKICVFIRGGETSIQGQEERALNTRELQKCHTQ
jgi:hypothetical protein